MEPLIRRDILKRLSALKRRRDLARMDLRGVADLLRQAVIKSGGEEFVDEYLKALNLMTLAEMQHPDLTAVTRTIRGNGIPNTDSFWSQIAVRRRRKQLGILPEKHLGIAKDDDIRFAKSADIRCVQTRYRGSFEGIPRDLAPVAVKPIRSSDSLGVFLNYGGELFAVASSRRLADGGELEATARNEISLTEFEDAVWEVEDLVTFYGCPAPDVKFYAFYGEIGAIIEVHRYPDIGYAYFDGDGNRIQLRNTVAHPASESSVSVIESGHVSEEDVQSVRSMSSSIPVPFMRLDFLLSDHGLVFCEMSSAPGDAHDLTSVQDQRLGRMYHEAEIRLLNDLLDGKRFKNFERFQILGEAER